MESRRSAIDPRPWALERSSPTVATPEIDHLWRHITTSYHALRLGIGLIGLAFPLTLWWGGLVFGTELKASMSAYYWTGMRDVFIGLLFVVGAFLYLYKGFSAKENVALNLAGFSAVGVALVPEGTSKAHGACAVFLFLCIAYVSIFRNSDTLKYVLDERRKAGYTRTYRVLGILMIVFPLTAFVLISALQVHLTNKNVTFAVELAGIWAFAAFWLVKSLEIRRTQEDAREVARGEAEVGTPPERATSLLSGAPGAAEPPALERGTASRSSRPPAKASGEARFLV